ncbi:hypothetical protein HW555_008427, partial [Spodoptera exigua]
SRVSNCSHHRTIDFVTLEETSKRLNEDLLIPYIQTNVTGRNQISQSVFQIELDFTRPSKDVSKPEILINSCAGCNRFASATEGVKCGNNRCRRLYHRGCVGFKPDVAVPASWRCPECKKNQVRDNRAETPVRGSAGSAGDPASQACVVARTTDEFDVSGSGPAPVVCEQQCSGPASASTPLRGDASSAAVAAREVSPIVGSDLGLLMVELRAMRAEIQEFRKEMELEMAQLVSSMSSCNSLKSKKKIALTELEILQLKNRLEVYKTLEHDFDVNQTLIEDIVGVSDEQLKEREQFDSEYQNQLALAMQLMRDSESTGITDGSESSAALRQLIDTVSKNLRALDSLDEKTQFWDTLIIYLVASKLDSVTLRHWEVYKNTLNAKPVLQNLKTYLKDRADLLQTLEEKHKQNHVDIKSNKPAQNQTSTSRSPSCPLCKAQHYLFSCPDFKQMTVEKRIERVSKMNVCSNCLYPGHEKKTCRGGTCKYCSLKHNTLLHIEKPKSSSITCTSTQQTSVLLSTTLVDVLGSDGTFHTARCLLDNGSTSSYVTKNLCTRLNLTLESINGSVSGINGQKTNILYRTNIQIKSLHNSFTMNSSCLVLDEISNLIPNIHQLSRFWELDSLSDSQNTDPCDADACEVIFKQTTTRQSDGRFVVTIPFKMSPDCLGNSYYQAKKRFLCLENRTDDESTLLEIATGVNTELKKYQFPLRKWKTNCPAVLRKLGFDNDSKDNILKHSTPQSWYYIPSKQNPADIITKCTNAQQLINSDLWFSGPDFLRNDDNKCWPEQPRHLSVSDLPEIRSQSHLTHTDENSFIHNYSNFNKLTRIVAYMLRFVNCCREKQNNSNKNKKLCVGQIKPLNTVELNNARYQLAKIIQQHSFPDDGVAPWTYFENLSWTRRSGARSRYKNQQGNDKKRL